MRKDKIPFETLVNDSGERLAKIKLDSSKIRNELGWSDNINIDEGIRNNSMDRF